jgi:hypothetical protein
MVSLDFLLIVTSIQYEECADPPYNALSHQDGKQQQYFLTKALYKYLIDHNKTMMTR